MKKENKEMYIYIHRKTYITTQNREKKVKTKYLKFINKVESNQNIYINNTI